MRSITHISVLHLAALPLILRLVNGFSFSTSTPQQCSDFTVQWTGGKPPYQLVIVPTIEITGGRIINMTLPEDLTDPYSYTFKLEEPTGQEFIVAMSDSQGFGTGGTTSVLTVGSSSDSSCLPSGLNYDFFFSINPDSNPTACSSMAISWPENATEPVSLFGLIPHGTAWNIPIDQNSLSYEWRVNIREQTRFLLFMSDNGPYQTGGSTPLYQVRSGSTDCINDKSPTTATGGEPMTWATTASSPTASVSGVGGSSSGGSDGETSSSKTGAIVGGTVGGVAFLVLLAILLFFCIKRRARRSDRDSDPGLKSYGIAGAAGEKGRRSHQLDLVDGDDAELGGGRMRLSGDESPEGARQVEMNGDVYEPSPFRYPSPPETPGGPLASGAGAGAGAASRPNTLTPSSLNTPEMLAMASEKAVARSSTNTRPSVDSNIPHSPVVGSAAGSTGVPATEASNQATVGHGPVGRLSSIRKAPSAQHMAGPSSGSGATHVNGSANAGEEPDGVEGNGETRFVQHEDAGQIVDLPPRYDQLRARNPDEPHPQPPRATQA